ncbi:VOC family protein [Ethanoligenens harbinense]|uniref:Glyoxalase/bleomycin resistance protein/dioxygenase n=1 Tax=Ethanoligenens harbinense (strain DSM 18485 / JCM 12961 / CGMCC 1.5033 / YUAN-3) TaxID=663278 RepID=E6U7R7_ETHHY|nr:VOC family protein [Ethanoligenens harbinense]ADU28190.1 Glyoxalase/bleomycin resistance protein/dioxygenase [Ethanoligenens harbinense YUAN-3]QCN93436.1 VOC family protein [Ethanoligenens harbinense]
MEQEKSAPQATEWLIRPRSVVIDCTNAGELADFYAALLGWQAEKGFDGLYCVSGGASSFRLLISEDEGYVPPVWPEEPGRQQKGMHLDFTVDDLDKAAAYAVSLGAVKSAKQYNPKQWITLFDPAGHPFCLCLSE